MDEKQTLMVQTYHETDQLSGRFNASDSLDEYGPPRGIHDIDVYIELETQTHCVHGVNLKRSRYW